MYISVCVCVSFSLPNPEIQDTTMMKTIKHAMLHQTELKKIDVYSSSSFFALTMFDFNLSKWDNTWEII